MHSAATRSASTDARRVAVLPPPCVHGTPPPPDPATTLPMHVPGVPCTHLRMHTHACMHACQARVRESPVLSPHSIHMHAHMHACQARVRESPVLGAAHRQLANGAMLQELLTQLQMIAASGLEVRSMPARSSTQQARGRIVAACPGSSTLP